MRSENDEEGGRAKLPKFWTLSPPNNDDDIIKLDPLAKAVLVSGNDDDLEWSDFYKHCLNAMLAGSSLDKPKKVRRGIAVLIWWTGFSQA